MARKNKTQEETQMTDVEEFELEDEPAAAEESETAPAKQTRKKDELPEGWETPTAFAHRLTEELDGYSKENPFKPQQVYGYCKNGKDFPTKIHTDGRYLVEIEPGLEWVKERAAKRAERAAAKAAAEAAATEDAETVAG
jgi:hypothetical protein